jgi:hypothetical protein
MLHRWLRLVALGSRTVRHHSAADRQIRPTWQAWSACPCHGQSPCRNTPVAPPGPRQAQQDGFQLSSYHSHSGHSSSSDGNERCSAFTFAYTMRARPSAAPGEGRPGAVPLRRGDHTWPDLHHLGSNRHPRGNLRSHEVDEPRRWWVLVNASASAGFEVQRSHHASCSPTERTGLAAEVRAITSARSARMTGHWASRGRVVECQVTRGHRRPGLSALPRAGRSYLVDI